mmetsp:Transcript_33270/g.24441  ORF Transcript_33270/g.24441 Transcript_33270/m.24441 type:complete len:82 (+) Transcript_33270:25-270(+)
MPKEEINSSLGFEDDYYPLFYPYLENRKAVLVNFMDYLRLESAYNPSKEFKFGIVVQQSDEQRAELYDGGFESKTNASKAG